MKFFQKELFPLRFAIYLILTGLLFHLTNVLVGQYGWKWAVPEKGFLEYSQVGMLTLICFGLFHLAILDKKNRLLLSLLAFVTFAAIVRENNNHPYYNAIIPGVWKAVLGGTVLLACAIWKPREILSQAKSKLNQPAFLMQLLGFAVTVLWAQTLAQKELLSEQADRAVEEVLELAGYLFIFFGVLEEYIAWWNRPALISFSRSVSKNSQREQEVVH